MALASHPPFAAGPAFRGQALRFRPGWSFGLPAAGPAADPAPDIPWMTGEPGPEPDFPAEAGRLFALARGLEDRGNFFQAEWHYRACLVLLEREKAEPAACLVRVCRRLAGLNALQCRFRESEIFFLRCLQFLQGLKAEARCETAAILDDYAGMLRDKAAGLESMAGQLRKRPKD